MGELENPHLGRGAIMELYLWGGGWVGRLLSQLMTALFAAHVDLDSLDAGLCALSIWTVSYP